MYKPEIKIRKVLPGIAVPVIIVLVLVMRLLTIGSLNDENVKNAICNAISSEYGVEKERIVLVDTSVSKAFLKIKVKQRAVVLAEYIVLDDSDLAVEKGKKYFRVKYNNLTGKWNSPYETSVFWYYFNF